MKLPAVGLPRLGLAAFRQRILFRGVFLALAGAVLALAVALLIEEKERSYQLYTQHFGKTMGEVAAKLRHPAGQLALLNPISSAESGTLRPALSPLLLPFGAIDFDDQHKAWQAVETAGCSVQYPNGASLCVAIGSNPYAGGFIYLVGSFFSGPLVARDRTQTTLDQWHRARITLTMRGETTRWIAPFEAQYEPGAAARGRLTGFVETAPLAPDFLPKDAKPVRDFRGWLWQDGACAEKSLPPDSDCSKRSYFSIRLPVDVLREALFPRGKAVVWPPADLEQIRVRAEVLAPSATLFDSDAPGATLPFSLRELAQLLPPGERLEIRSGRASSGMPPMLTLVGKGALDDQEAALSAPWVESLVRRLPVARAPGVIEASEVIRTAAGSFELRLTGDLKSVDARISAVATRMSWFVAAMLGAILLAWVIIEVGLIRRITELTRRAAAVSRDVSRDAHSGQSGWKAEEKIGSLEVADLRGRDELGILAGGLSDLLQRVKGDVARERIRAQQERDMWHAVGHEIMSPLQSLMVLHPKPTDTSHRYVQRMQQAVRVLYGTASPSEALEAASLNVATLDLNEFLAHVAENAAFAGIAQVSYQRLAAEVAVRADEFSLEDVVTHLLRNADRFRLAGTPIVLTLTVHETIANLAVFNQGPAIEEALLARVFEYGVSESGSAAHTDRNETSAAHRGQGLFVVKTYMAKMGGMVAVENVAGGVTFTLSLSLERR